MLRVLFTFQLILTISRGNPSFENYNEIGRPEPEPDTLILATPLEDIYSEAYPYHDGPVQSILMSQIPREESLELPETINLVPQYMDDAIFVREDDLGDANDDSEDLDDHGGHSHHKQHGHGWDPCENRQIGGVGGINCGYNWFNSILTKHDKDLSRRRQDWDYTNRNYDVTRWYSNGWGWTNFPYGHPLDEYRPIRSYRGIKFSHPLDKYGDYSDPDLSKHLTWKYWAMKKKFSSHWEKFYHYYR